MKVILIGSFPICIPLYGNLLQHKYLQGVCFEESAINSNNNFHNTIQAEGLETFIINTKNISNQFKDWLQDQSPDLILVCGFSIKIPANVLSIPTYGFLNIHFGKLPENRGPDPLFWSIKNGDRETAITIHQMDSDWDTGKILMEQSVPIIPGETLGMVNSKMSYMLTSLTQKAIELVTEVNNFKPQLTTESIYYKRPDEKDTTISWETQTADEIEQLVNACNPKYGGATTYYQGSPIKIVEVSPVDTQPLLGKTAGEIVHAHPQEGLYVYCKYGQLIRINIIKSDAGTLTGHKYANIGMQVRQKFTTTLSIEKELVTK